MGPDDGEEDGECLVSDPDAEEDGGCLDPVCFMEVVKAGGFAAK